MRKTFFLLSVLAFLFLIAYSSNIFNFKDLKSTSFFSKPSLLSQKNIEKQTISEEESAVIKAIDMAIPSVVTIGISKTTTTRNLFEIDPFNPFSPFNRIPQESKKIEQNIGSGFIISEDGLIVTNKHVVSDTEAQYQILTNDDKKYSAAKIYRDPLNDLAIIKIDAHRLKPLDLGESSHLKLGQFVIAIGTPLGEFRNTVTQGIISGLGRGITAGSPFESYVERLDNVIQTDAAISPGNSGGPLIGLNGKAIGVNTAISQEGQNIGFAIPISIVKELIKNFNDAGGKIEHAFLGVRYKMIDKQTAILNDVPEGAYIISIVDDSPASKAELQEEDVITVFDAKKIRGDDDETLQKLIAQKKVGDTVTLTVWRNGKTMKKEVTLGNFE
ncbi:MAG TPA: trypsin-like peptidase domain-containing protein [Patescibacteria group bacterium]|nr:trypsin-like peptidase domain-containing protein [Patescibacteria group bacterium]